MNNKCESMAEKNLKRPNGIENSAKDRKDRWNDGMKTAKRWEWEKKIVKRKTSTPFFDAKNPTKKKRYKNYYVQSTNIQSRCLSLRIFHVENEKWHDIR